MKRVMLASMLAAAPAFAQTPDPLCGSLDTAIAAAAETPLPFASLGPDGKAPVDANGKVPSFFAIANPPGLTDAKACRVDVAGSIYGSNTGVPRDKVECELIKVSEDADPDGGKKAKAAAEAVAARIGACLTPKGWTAAPPAGESGSRERVQVWRFTKPESKVSIEARFETFVFGRTKYVEDYTAKAVVFVEVPNTWKPAPPKSPG